MLGKRARRQEVSLDCLLTLVATVFSPHWLWFDDLTVFSITGLKRNGSQEMKKGGKCHCFRPSIPRLEERTFAESKL